MERPLYIAPEDEEDEGRGRDFLYQFEEEKSTAADMEGRLSQEELTVDQDEQGKITTQEHAKKTSNTP